MADVASSNLVVPADLFAAGTTLNGRAHDIVAELDALKSQLAPIADTWIGPAASYYQPLQAEWNIAAEGLFGPDGILGQIASALNLSWNNYSECEWSNVQSWKRG
jgi:uncharacterized protein YukE